MKKFKFYEVWDANPELTLGQMTQLERDFYERPAQKSRPSSFFSFLANNVFALLYFGLLAAFFVLLVLALIAGFPSTPAHP